MMAATAILAWLSRLLPTPAPNNLGHGWHKQACRRAEAMMQCVGKIEAVSRRGKRNYFGREGGREEEENEEE